MNAVICAIFAVLSVVNAGLVAPLAGTVIQGPSSRTTVVGPDGSSISSVAPGGTIVAENGGAVVAQAAPATVIAPATRIAYAAPAIAYAAPAVAYAAPAIAYAAPAYAAIPTVGAENTIVSGPSGTIAQTKAIHGAHIVY